MTSTCPYVSFQFFDKNGQALNIANDLVISAVWSRSLNSVGTAILTIPADCTDYTFETISQEDLGLMIEVAFEQGQAAVNDLETYWLLRRFRETNVDDKSAFRLTFRDANHILDRRIVAYRADDPQGTSPNARINEPGNVALKRVFDTNYGTDAGLRSLAPYVSSAGIAVPSPVIEKEIQFKNVLNTLKQIARTSRDKGTPLFFDLVAIPTATDVKLEFRTYVNQRGQDKSYDTIHTSNPLFDLTSFEIDYDIPNTAYVAGIGRGQDRQVETATNARATSGRYTRYEDFKSVRSGVSQVLADEAQNLVNNVFGIVRLEGQLLGDLALQYSFGDRVTVSHRNFEVVCEVTNIGSDLSQQIYTRTVVVKSIE